MLDRGNEHKPQGGRLGLDRKKSSLWGGKPLEQGQGRLLPVREVFRAGLDKALRHLECSCFELEVGPVTSRGSSQPPEVPPSLNCSSSWFPASSSGGEVAFWPQCLL